MTNTLCLIPAKGCSTRLPKKNLLKLGNDPLIVRIVNKAKEADVFERICVSTESDEIAAISKATGAEVPFIRPEILSRDPSTIVDVVLHAIKYYELVENINFNQVCVLLPTTPFVSVEDIKDALNIFKASDEKALLSVSKTEYPPFNAWVIDTKNDQTVLAPCFPNSPYRQTKSTECPATYRSNGAILIVDVDYLKRHKGYQSGVIIPFEMPMAKSVDIDTETDYLYAKFLDESGIFENE